MGACVPALSSALLHGIGGNTSTYDNILMHPGRCRGGEPAVQGIDPNVSAGVPALPAALLHGARAG